MTYDDVITMLEEAGLPLAYDHFAEGESPDPPFLVFLYPGSDNMFAGNRNIDRSCCIRTDHRQADGDY